MSKVSPVNHKPFDDILFIRFPAWLGRVLPPSLMTPGLKSAVLESYPEQLKLSDNCYGAPDPDISSTRLCVSANYMDKVKDVSLNVVPGIQSVQDKSVTFVDGSRQDFDVIIACTGYGPVLDFLPSHVQDELLYKGFGGKNEMALYHDCLVPNLDWLTNLAFCGIGTFVGPSHPVFEIQARLIAGVVQWNDQTSTCGQNEGYFQEGTRSARI